MGKNFIATHQVISNVPVERHAAALCQTKRLYRDSSITSDAQRSFVACPLQRKLDAILVQDFPVGDRLIS